MKQKNISDGQISFMRSIANIESLLLENLSRVKVIYEQKAH